MTFDASATIIANSSADGTEHGWNLASKTTILGGTWNRAAKKRLLHVKANGCVLRSMAVSGNSPTSNDQIGIYVRQGYTNTLIIGNTINDQGIALRVSRLCHSTMAVFNTIDNTYEHAAYFSQSHDCEFSYNAVTNAGSGTNGNFCKMQIDDVGGAEEAISPRGWRCTNNFGDTASDNGWQTNRTGGADASLYLIDPVVSNNVAISTTGNAYRVSSVSGGILKDNRYFDSPAPNNTDSTFAEESNNTLEVSEPINDFAGASFLATDKRMYIVG